MSQALLVAIARFVNKDFRAPIMLSGKYAIRRIIFGFYWAVLTWFSIIYQLCGLLVSSGCCTARLLSSLLCTHRSPLLWECLFCNVGIKSQKLLV